MTIGVYNLGFIIIRGTDFGKIVQVDMAVNQVFRLKNPHKPEKSAKALVAQVLPVVDAPGSGMGQEHVKKTPPEQAVEKQGRNKAQNLTVHLEIGVLVVPPVIPHGPPQPGHDEVPFPDHPAADMDGAVPAVHVKGLALIRKGFQIVVSKHEQEGLVQAGNDKIQIVYGKVPGSKNQVYIFKSLFY
jgi:hypothetical protein